MDYRSLTVYRSPASFGLALDLSEVVPTSPRPGFAGGLCQAYPGGTGGSTADDSLVPGYGGDGAG